MTSLHLLRYGSVGIAVGAALWLLTGCQPEANESVSRIHPAAPGILTGSFNFVANTGLAMPVKKLPDGGMDRRVMGIVLANLTNPPTNPCPAVAYDAGVQPFSAAALITIGSPVPIDGGTFFVGSSSDGGPVGMLEMVGAQGYSSPQAFGSFGSIVLNALPSRSDGGISGSYSMRATTWGATKVDAGVVTGTFNVPLCQ